MKSAGVLQTGVQWSIHSICHRQSGARPLDTQVTGQHAGEEEIERMIESGESETIFQKAILEQVRERSGGQEEDSARAIFAFLCWLPAVLAPSLQLAFYWSCPLCQGRGYVMDTLAEIRERRDAGADNINVARADAALMLPWCR